MAERRTSRAVEPSAKAQELNGFSPSCNVDRSIRPARGCLAMTLLPGRAHRWRRASSVCAACVLIAASVALRAAAQPLETASAREPRSSIDDVTEPLLARVEAEEARDGPFSRNLIDFSPRWVLLIRNTATMI